VWLCIIIVEVLHGITRTLFLTPALGDFRARQVAVLTGSCLILIVATSFNRRATDRRHLPGGGVP
jgi:hypothetical protein